MKKLLMLVLGGMLAAAMPLSADTETVGGYTWTYSINGDTVAIGKGLYYAAISPEPTGALTIPSTLGGKSVTRIGDYAFDGCSGLTSVTIPDSVTNIGYYAFGYCSGLTSVTIGNGVASIASFAFDHCSGLMSISVGSGNANYKSVNGLLLTKDGTTLIQGVNGDVTIPSSVTSIGSSAFYYCKGLTSVTIPDSVTSIGKEAFYSCSGLKSMTIGNGVTSIGSSAFVGCGGLMNITVSANNTAYKSIDGLLISKDGTTLIRGVNGDVTIPGSVTSIGKEAFYNCRDLTSVTISNGVTSIGSYAFSGCSGLPSVTIPDSVTSIGSSVFSACSGLTSVTIGNGVTSIGSDAFYNCSGLKSMTIGNGVTSIGLSAFGRCGGLTNITVSANNVAYKSIDGLLMNKSGTTLIRGVNGDVTIPDGVTSIGYDAFSYCSGLTSVTIPSSVTSIGGGAFSYCSGLTSMTIPSSVTSIGYGAFDYCSGLTSVTIPQYVLDCQLSNVFPSSYSTITNVSYSSTITNIGYDAFSGCSGLMSVTIPNSVTSIRSSAFSGCSGLTSVTIPDSVTNIGYYAFSGCSGLTSVTIPQCVLDGQIKNVFPASYSTITNVLCSSITTNIGNYAFSDCSGLMSVTIPDSVTYVGEHAFHNCNSLKGVYITDLSAWCRISFADSWANPLAYAHTLYLNDSSITNLAIPDSVTSIGGHAFHGCRDLTSVTIPDSVTNIGSYAFCNCYGLTSVTISNGVTSIGDYVFYDCRGLKSVTIPDGVTRIGDYAFDGCSGLPSVTIPDGVTSIGYRAFYYCSGLKSVTIPDSVTSIGESAFGLCGGLTSVAIGGSVTNIVESVFEDCGGLTNITVSTNNTAYKSIDGLLMSKDGTTLIRGVNGDVTIPDSVTSIGPSAFSCCRGLKSVTIPSGVTSIWSSAFSECSGLTSVTIPQCVLDGQIRNVFPSSYSSITNVSYSSVITNIGGRAFYGCSGLMSVTIPDSVTSIGYGAFYDCSSLKGVYITDLSAWCRISFVDSWANPLAYAHALYLNGSLITNLTIPDSVTSIGDWAFYNCRDLKNIMIGNGATNIGYGAFCDCSGLTSVTIPDSVTSIGEYAFWNCTSWTTVHVKKGDADRVRSLIKATSWYDITNKLEFIEDLPSSFTVTFYGGGKTLGTATVEKGKNTNQAAASQYKPTRAGYVLTGWYDANGNILFDAQGRAANGMYWNGSYVKGTSSATWKYAGNVTAYANWAPASGKYMVTFYGGGKTLGTATVETGKNTNQAAASAYKPTRAGYVLTGWYDANGKILFDAQGRAANGDYWNGSYVKGTSSATWKYAGNVTAYANWVPATGKYTVTFYGGGKTLGTATVETGKNTNQAAASQYKPTRAGYVLTGWYDKDGKILFDAQGRAANGMYWNGSYVKGSSSASWKYAGNVTAYANWAPVKYVVTFYGGGKTLGTATMETGKNTNQAAASLYKPTRAGYVLSGWYDANGKILFDAQGRAVNGDYWNGSYVKGTSSATWKYAGNVTAYANWTEAQTPTLTIDANGVLVKVDLNGATAVTIPSTVRSIGSYAFYNMRDLASVTIPSSVTSIRDYAFFCCYGLTDVTIPSSVTSIGEGAFYYCSGLTSMPIPNSVTNIGDGAFYGCSGLADASGYVIIRDVLYYYCGSEANVTIPSGVTRIGNWAFEYCSGLRSVTIPSSVTSIGEGAFYGCSGLTSMPIPSSVTNIGDGAFYDCTSWATVHVGKDDTERVRGLIEASGYNTGNLAFVEDVTSRFTVTFYGGGKTLGTATVETGKNTNQAAASAYKPTRTGYTLSGWYDAKDNILFDAQGRAVNGMYWNGSYVKGTSSATWKYAGNVTAYAHWIPNSNAAARKVPGVAVRKGDDALFVPGELAGIFADGEGVFALTLDEGLETAYLVTWTADGGVTCECEATVADDTLVLTTEEGEVYRLTWDGGSLVAMRVATVELP